MWQILMQAANSIMGRNAARRAGAETARGELQEAQSVAKVIRRKAKEARSSATAAIAASGVSLEDGTPLLLDREIIQRSEEDAMAALLTGKRRARAAKEGGQLGGQQAILQGAGDIANSWIKSSRNTSSGGSSGSGLPSWVWSNGGNAGGGTAGNSNAGYNGGGYNA